MNDQDISLEIVYKAGSALQAALSVRDDYTQNHCERVAEIAAYSGEKFGLTGEEICNLRSAAVFHDIGKIGIPDKVLMKPGRFTPDEYEVMKTHSTIGESLVEKLDIPNSKAIADIVRAHHERFDGTGYPDSLAGEEISLSARIITTIDVYDALSTKRCYRNSLPQADVFGRMEAMVGSVIDPDVHQVVMEVIREMDT